MILLFKPFQDYLADLSGKHKLVAHGQNGRKSFFRMDGEEAVAAIPNNAGSPYAMVNGFTGRVVGEDLPRLEHDVSIVFLSKAKANIGNRADETERAMQEAYDVMMDFLTRITKDYEEDGGCGMLQYLQPDRVTFGPVGPVGQFEYGWELQLPFRTNMPVYNPDNWTE